jgi:uncharacterized repeat protein (TIGR03803 family)
LIFDANGNLYGTTNQGGASGVGLVFKLSSRGKETVLYSFTGGADGRYPGAGSLIWDAKGNLYGTASGGGNMSGCHNQGCGVVFKVNKERKETVLYTFTGGADGSSPQAGLIWDAEGNLYGTTVDGGDMSGCHNDGCGVVFKVNRERKETVLYTFTGGADGANPFAGVIWDAKGNLYGTDYDGGDASGCNQGCGTVFKLNKSNKETVLYSFTAGADGEIPSAGVIWDAKGNLYGTTTDGGDGSGCQNNGWNGCGTVFKLNKSNKETVLYSFTGGADEGYPQAGLIWDAKGNLYGTTTGGPTAFGTVFKLTP